MITRAQVRALLYPRKLKVTNWEHMGSVTAELEEQTDPQQLLHFPGFHPVPGQCCYTGIFTINITQEGTEPPQTFTLTGKRQLEEAPQSWPRSFV